MRYRRVLRTLGGFICLSAVASGRVYANIVVNGDFEAGNSGFASSYGYVPPTSPIPVFSSCGPAGVYTIGSDPGACHSDWPHFGAHGGTQMMIINGAGSSGTVWQEAGLTILPNTTYLLSAWVASMSSLSPAQLVFSINGVPAGNALNANGPAGDWQQFSVLWNSGGQTMVSLDIVDLNIQGSGNDFALDDIALVRNSPAPEPNSLLLFGAALVGMGMTRRRWDHASSTAPRAASGGRR